MSAHTHEHHHHVVPQGGPVTLDIGGDIGALIAYVDAARLGTEIHVHAEGDPDPSRTTHTGVWERTMGPQSVIVAVFAELAQDRYGILDDDGRVTHTVIIRGGEITEVDLTSN
jgi:hypothetical protein